MKLKYAALALIIFTILLVVYWQMPKGEQMATTHSSEALAQVIVPVTLSEQSQRGEIAFNQYCANCHGANAVGQDGIAPPLIHIYYEPNHHGDAAFLVAIARGVQAHHWPFGNMPPVEGISQDQAIDIIAYVREIQRANGIE